MNSASNAAADLRAWLDEEGLVVAEGADGLVLDVSIPDADDRTVRIVVLEPQGLLLFLMVADVAVPRSRWPALYPLLAEVNAQIVLGAWYLDPHADKLCFRLALPARGVAYEAQALRDAMMHVVQIVGATEAAFAPSAAQGAADSAKDVLAAWADEDSGSGH